MSTSLFEELIKDSAEHFQKLESSEEYKSLISRKNDLQKKKDTIIDEIYEYREMQNTVENLTKTKLVIENAIKEVDNKLKSMKSALSEGVGLGFVLKSLKTDDPFEEFFNPKKTSSKQDPKQDPKQDL